jgi:hypothetical protein
MSLTDTIGADLQAMAAGVDRSQQETAAVDHAIDTAERLIDPAQGRAVPEAVVEQGCIVSGS